LAASFISGLGIVTGRARPRGALQLGRRNRLPSSARAAAWATGAAPVTGHPDGVGESGLFPYRHF